jgi:hypothetical protein
MQRLLRVSTQPIRRPNVFRTRPLQRRCLQTEADKVEPAAPTPSTSSSETTQQPPAVPPLPFLSRPLGVRERPRTAPLTPEEKKAELLDKDKHLEKRRHM